MEKKLIIYYCRLILSNCSNNFFEVEFPDFFNIYTYGNSKDHALEMAKDALELTLKGKIENGNDINLPKNYSKYGLFLIEISPQISKYILEYNIKKIKKQLEQEKENICNEETFKN